MVDLGKQAPRTFKAYMATVTLHSDRVEIKRGRLARLAGNRDVEIPLSEIVQVQHRDPTVMVNGCVFLATADDVKTVQAVSLTQEKTMAANPHTVLFTWQQRRRYARLREALKAVLPEVPTVPVG